MKIQIGLFFGGNSVEHEVSVISGLQAFEALDREKYDVIPVYISKDNRFYIGEGIGSIKSYKNMTECLKKADQVIPVKLHYVFKLVIGDTVRNRGCPAGTQLIKGGTACGDGQIRLLLHGFAVTIR